MAFLLSVDLGTVTGKDARAKRSVEAKPVFLRVEVKYGLYSVGPGEPMQTIFLNLTLKHSVHFDRPKGTAVLFSNWGGVVGGGIAMVRKVIAV